jgi:hypothetical protein
MSIETMKLALECMEAAIKAGDWKVDGACDPDYVFVCLRAAIEQAEKQEPVAWMYEFGTDNADAVHEVRWYPNVHWKKPTGLVRNVVPLYTAPPQREWQELTDTFYEQLAEKHVTNCYFDTLTYAKAIEQALKEKNS